MKKNGLIIIAILLTVIAQAKVTYKFRITLKDKANTEYTLDAPQKFLSKKAILRREKQILQIDSTDLPVSRKYLEQIESTRAKILLTSKWNNTVLVRCEDSLLINRISMLPFVQKVELVWSGEEKECSNDAQRIDSLTNKFLKTDNYYGAAYRQIEIHNGHKLHEAGFRGQGMTVAIIDAGFKNANKLDVLKSLKLLGTRDFIQSEADIFEQNNHGTAVLSCMAANEPNVMVGTAPEASYWLLRSEDNDSESPVEQDYWAAAIEFADSVGVDVVNTSLGYNLFDDKSKNMKYCELDGRTSLIARSASRAADKGMIVVCSAGNEGRNSWKKIKTPGDAFNVLTVAAIDAKLQLAPFSSVGNTADNRVKPDVSAIGQRSAILLTNGEIGSANGTSFSSPIMCGLVTCLWQACPKFTAKQMLELVRKSCNNYTNPDNIFGYGIPDIYKAYLSTRKQLLK